MPGANTDRQRICVLTSHSLKLDTSAVCHRDHLRQKAYLHTPISINIYVVIYWLCYVLCSSSHKEGDISLY